MALRYPEDYHKYFDSKTYLETFYKTFKGNENEDGSVVPFIKPFHDFWSFFKAPSQTDIRHLEFGGGPCINNLVFSSPKVNHIVFAEYTESNRQAVKSWIAGDPEAHDWTPFIEVVLELEQGTSDNESATEKDKVKSVLNRANEVKQKTKSVVPCDVTKSPIVQLDKDDVGKPFDVISSSLCLEACVSSEEHYKNAIAELGRLIKPNGYLFMNGVLEQTFYFVGKEKFYTFLLTEKLIKEAMNEAGFEDTKFETIPVDYSEVCDCKNLFFTYGKKCAEK